MRYLVIVNPVSGFRKGRKIWSQIEHLFAEAGEIIQVFHTEYEGHPKDIVLSYDFTTIDAIVALGGDGTMHEIINGMLNRVDQKQVPIGLVAAGTGNSLMHDLSSLDPFYCTERILSGNKMKIDLAEINHNEGKLFAFNVIGWGLPTSINMLAEKMRLLKTQRYNVASLIEIIRNPKWKVNLKVGDKKINEEYAFFLACNTMYTGKGMKMAPLAKLNDGLFDIVMLKHCSRPKLIRLFSKIFKGNHIHDDAVHYYQEEEFSVSDSKWEDLFVDGHALVKIPVNIKVLRDQVEIFC